MEDLLITSARIMAINDTSATSSHFFPEPKNEAEFMDLKISLVPIQMYLVLIQIYFVLIQIYFASIQIYFVLI